jgi:predicted Holliday junction resolvase-like endonuclease
MERKAKEEKELKKDQKRSQQEIDLAKKKKQIEAQHKFEEWLHTAKNRPKSVPNSFGYTSGKLTGKIICHYFIIFNSKLCFLDFLSRNGKFSIDVKRSFIISYQI